MSVESTSRGIGRAAVLVAALLAPADALGDAATPACRSVHGQIALSPVPVPACAAPTGLCMAGVYTGALTGSSFFPAESVTPMIETPTTSIVLVTGEELLPTADGTLRIRNVVALHTTGDGQLLGLGTIAGGTGAFVGATGSLTVRGTFTAAGGSAEYAGELCVP